MAEQRGSLSRGISRGPFRPHKHPSPPPYLGSLGDDVHSWEKQFFNYGCPDTWEQPSHGNQFTLSYKKVQEWDDSGGLEALLDANFWLWAKMNNYQCNIPLPDPDMYLDDVDYDAIIDPELVADLHYPEPEQDAPVDSSGSYMNESIRATEAIDAQVPVPTSGLTDQQLSAKLDVLVIGNTIQPAGWNVAENTYGCDVRGKSFSNGAYDSRWRTNDGRGTARVKNCWQGNEQHNAWNSGMHKTSGHRGNTSNEAFRKYGRGCFDSRKTISGFRTDQYPSSSGGKNFRGKQSRFDHNENTTYAGRRTTLQWRPKSSVRGNKRAPIDAGATLRGEKSVSQ